MMQIIVASCYDTLWMYDAVHCGSILQDTEEGEPEVSDWERYAAEEYELLVAEEGANDNHEEL